MLYGIVDIGSNTVRLNIYDRQGSITHFLLSKKYALGLASYKEKKKLTVEGCKRLLNVLKDIKCDLEELNVDDYDFFATASLRNINNSDEVLDKVKEEVGLDIDILSDEKEGEYSFLGSISIMKKNDGVLIDVGGGSTEIVIYKDKKIKEVYSLAIGSLTLFDEYVGLLVPTNKESKKIEERVICELEKEGVKKRNIKYMCGVGGSVRAVNKLLKDLNFIKSKRKFINPKVFPLLREELKDNTKTTYKKLLATKPSRIHTMIPGLIIIQEICTFFNVEELQVSKYGVREGFLNAKIGK